MAKLFEDSVGKSIPVAVRFLCLKQTKIDLKLELARCYMGSLILDCFGQSRKTAFSSTRTIHFNRQPVQFFCFGGGCGGGGANFH
jgi:hypothetical protein